MENENLIVPVAHIHTDFPTKFGIPRQSGLADTKATVVFDPEFRDLNAVRGLEDFSHIWLIWQFSQNPKQEVFCPTVRPPRLGGNTRMGVFATRSPFRPNGLGLSSVKLEKIEHHTELGPVLHVAGADLADGTPIIDIKPYIPYTDSHPNASGGFADSVKRNLLNVHIPDETALKLPCEKAHALMDILANDPRPSYHNDPERVYGFEYAGFEIKFTVNGNVLNVTEIIQLK